MTSGTVLRSMDDPSPVHERLLTIVVLMLFSWLYSQLFINEQGYFNHQPELPNWQGESWITAGSSTGKGYFRKKFTVSSTPESAYVIVSATDIFSVYVNGSLIGGGEKIDGNPTGIFDLRNFLHSGVNLLAVEVESRLHDQAPGLIARMVIREQGEIEKIIKSDTSWKTSRSEGFQKAGSLAWEVPEYDDFTWNAAMRVIEGDREVEAVPIPEFLFKKFPQGNWVWSGTENTLIFFRQFFISGSYVNWGWVGVSTSGRYSLIVNGVPVAAFSGSDKSMDLLNISEYVLPGENSISLEVENNNELPAVLISTAISTDLGEIVFDSADDWQVYLSSTNQDAQKTLAGNVSYPISESQSSNLPVLMKEKIIENSLTANFVHLIQQVVIILAVLSVSLFVYLIFYYIGNNFSKIDFWSGLAEFIRPFVLGVVILGIFTLSQGSNNPDVVANSRKIILFSVPVMLLFIEIMLSLELLKNSED